MARPLNRTRSGWRRGRAAGRGACPQGPGAAPSGGQGPVPPRGRRTHTARKPCPITWTPICLQPPEPGRTRDHTTSRNGYYNYYKEPPVPENRLLGSTFPPAGGRGSAEWIQGEDRLNFN